MADIDPSGFNNSADLIAQDGSVTVPPIPPVSAAESRLDTARTAAMGGTPPPVAGTTTAPVDPHAEPRLDETRKRIMTVGNITPGVETQTQTQGQAVGGMGKELYAGFVQGMADSPQLQDIKNSPLAKMAPKIDTGLPLPLDEPEYQKQYGNSTSASVGRFMGHIYSSLPLMYAAGTAIPGLAAPALAQVPGQAVTQSAPLISPLVANTARNAVQSLAFSGASGDTPGQNLLSTALGAATGPLGEAAKYVGNSGIVNTILKHPVTQTLDALGTGAYALMHGYGPFESTMAMLGGGGAAHYIAKLAPAANALMRWGGSVLTSPAGPVMAGAVAPLGGPLASDVIPGM